MESRVYAVGRSVTQFPERQDLSTPESAYAAVARVRVAGRLEDWESVSLHMPSKAKFEAATRHWREAGAAARQKWETALLKAEITEVWKMDTGSAAVIAKIDESVHGSAFDVRHFALNGGRWLNSGHGSAGQLRTLARMLRAGSAAK
jgi:hypothetical protein